MAILASQLIGRVTILGAQQAQGQMLGLSAASDATEARFRTLAAIGGGLLAVGLVVAAGKFAEMAGTFQQGVNRLKTGAGDTQDSFATLASGILTVSTATGQLSGPLTQAMYQILSSGQRGAQAFDTLTAAAKGAVIEQADVVDVSKTLSTVMTDYGSKVFSASQFMNGLIAAVAHGKVTLQELSTSMGPILPIAKNLGISFADVAAAMTTQTNAGIPAERAATGLRFTMQALENPTKKAIDAMKSLGLSSVDVGNELKKSLPGALQMLYDAALKAGPEGSVPFNRAMADMSGGIRSLMTVSALTGPHMQAFVKNTEAISGAMKSGKGEVSGWSTAQSNFNVKLSEARAAFEAAGIKIGLVLLPALSKVLDVVTPLITAFGNFAAMLLSHKEAAAAFAGIIAALLVPALVAASVAAWGFAAAVLANPITWIALAIGVAVAGIILAIQHWGQITAWLQEQWSRFTAWFGGIFSSLGALVHGKLTDLKNAVGGAFDAMGTAVRDKLTEVKNTVGGAFSAMGTEARSKLTDFKNAVGQKFSDMGKAVHDSITATYTGVVDAGHWLYDHNTYVKKATDFVAQEFSFMGLIVHTVLTDVKNFVGNVFSAIGTFIHDRLTWIHDTVGAIFSAIGTFIHDKLTWLKNFIGGIFDTIGTWMRDKATWAKNQVGGAFDAMGSIVRSKLTDLKNFIGGIFDTIGTWMHDKIAAGWKKVTDFVSNWGALAYQWGVSLIQGLINGIWSKVGGVIDAVSTIAGKISNFLGFHSSEFGVPEMGPGRDADKWMPALMKGLAGGIKAYTPQFQAALNAVIKPPAMATGSLSGSTLLRPPTAASAAPQQIIVQPPDIYLDGVRLSQQLMPHFANRLRFGAVGIGR